VANRGSRAAAAAAYRGAAQGAVGNVYHLHGSLGRVDVEIKIVLDSRHILKAIGIVVDAHRSVFTFASAGACQV
jgi:hypothetical protein